MDAMELRFVVTAGQLVTLADSINARRNEKNEMQATKAYPVFLRLFSFWLPLLFMAVVFYFLLDKDAPETYVSLALSLIAYLLAWKFLLKRLVESRAPPLVLKKPPPDGRLEPLTLLRLKPLQGEHRVKIASSGLLFFLPNRKSVTVPWSRCCNLKQGSDFYFITVRTIGFFKATYLVAISGEVVGGASYQAGLDYLCSRLDIDNGPAQKA
ncbi:hypothetical protein EF096_05015 [Pseudomonas neustonica]|uniref:YcxB family protein n=1 Tax=Pseudomonas neustonica TaxID=2487346 RepID=A0ABX9XMT9_9PSED|nr:MULTISPECIES: hypothetical protein [Pseudomonas]ROZ85138.1 hypothetical protein EF099_06415 [Pseudomonas sp. SSM44]ROZ86575.1 hypothetical protein EF096_05015 [Pseudomonas neustonica]|tara:strand:+ start:142 stop:774 length:633 start_codon:yes stop_codon:yes gene_type:complete